MAQAFLQNSEQYVSQIDAEIERLQHLRGQVAEAIEGEKQIVAPKTTGRGMSAEGRLRVAEAQKARWAKLKKAAKKAAKAVVPKPAKKIVVKKVVAKKAAKKGGSGSVLRLRRLTAGLRPKTESPEQPELS